ncbi:hypothetical protein QQ008_11250 [Fulvivirgaceae bacterium BMA10]|uniref:Uncharacterized protein n=1 Tax=Splendidivirga corallicola TaxID=3051826 RepID=A0ABT8KPJ4_9BACT|nr:hypothetical protein [Fulvivirgaceae bacterium BMA10]
MRTSLNEIKRIEAHVFKQSPTGDQLAFEAQLMLDNELRQKVQWQKKAYNLIHAYGREQLRSEIEAVHKKLFTTRKYDHFRQKILRIFNR